MAENAVNNLNLNLSDPLDIYTKFFESIAISSGIQSGTAKTKIVDLIRKLGLTGHCANTPFMDYLNEGAGVMKIVPAGTDVDVTDRMILDITSLYFYSVPRIDLRNKEIPMTGVVSANTQFLVSAIAGLYGDLSKYDPTTTVKNVGSPDKAQMTYLIMNGIKNILHDRPWDKDESEDSEDSLFEAEVRKRYGNAVTGKTGGILSVYSYLFSGGYDVYPTIGIVIKADSAKYVILKEKRVGGKEGGMIGYTLTDKDKSSEENTDQLTNFVGQRLVGNAIQVDARTDNEIVNLLIKGVSKNAKLSFINKLAEYVFGYQSISAENLKGMYLKSDLALSWESFKPIIQQDIDSLLIKFIIKYLKDEETVDTIEKLKMQRSPKSNENLDIVVERLLDYAQSALTNICIVKKYDKISGRKTGNVTTDARRGLVTNFQFMACLPFDYESVYQNGSVSRTDLINSILKTCYGGSKGEIKGNESLGMSTPDLSNPELKVFEVGYEYNHTLANGMPRFAYKALESLQRRGVKPDVEHTILGASPSGEILTLNSDEIKLKNAMIHFIFAGSRSGKGVMTLNLLASQIYSNRAIFYLDRKPDMAVTFHRLSKGDRTRPGSSGMFLVNGSDYNPKYDKESNENQESVFKARVDALKANHPNIPDYAIKAFCSKKESDTLTEENIDDFFDGIFGDYTYFKAFLLVYGLIYGLSGPYAKAVKKNFPEYEEGITLIVDEITNLQEKGMEDIYKVFRTRIPPNKFSTEVSSIESKLSKNESSDKPKPVDATAFLNLYNPTSQYLLGIYNLMRASISSIEATGNAGMAVDTTKLDIFVIGQNCEQIPMSSSYFNEIRVAGSMGLHSGKLLQSHSPIFGLLSPIYKKGDSYGDALVGFDGKNPYCLAQKNPRSKAAGRLDDVARNFAYVPNLSNALEKIRRIDSTGKTRGGAEVEKTNLEIANSKSTVYFKPFLILNDCTYDFTGADNLENDDALFGICHNMGIDTDNIIELNPFDPTTGKQDRSGVGLDNRIGFMDYLYSAGLTDNDILQTLSKSTIIANRLVQEGFGYEGDWWDFITDFRWEYQFTLSDVVRAARNVGNNTGWKTSGEIKEAFADLTKTWELVDRINGKVDSGEDAQEFATETGFTSGSYDAERASQAYESMFGGFKTTPGDLLSGTRGVIDVNAAKEAQDLWNQGASSPQGLGTTQPNGMGSGQPSGFSFGQQSGVGSGQPSGFGQNAGQFFSSFDDNEGIDRSSNNQEDIGVGSRIPVNLQQGQSPKPVESIPVQGVGQFVNPRVDEDLGDFSGFGSGNSSQPQQPQQSPVQSQQPQQQPIQQQPQVKTIETIEVPDALRQKLSLLGMNPSAMSFDDLNNFARITGSEPPQVVTTEVPIEPVVSQQEQDTNNTVDVQGVASTPGNQIPQGSSIFGDIPNIQGQLGWATNEPISPVQSEESEIIDFGVNTTEQTQAKAPSVEPMFIPSTGVQGLYSSSSMALSPEEEEKQARLDEEVAQDTDQRRQQYINLYNSATSDTERVAIATLAESLGINLSTPTPDVEIEELPEDYYIAGYSEGVVPVPKSYEGVSEEEAKEYDLQLSDGCQQDVIGYTPDDDVRGFSANENYTYTRDQERPVYNAEELKAAYLQNIDSVVQYITNSVVEFGGGARNITKFVQRAETIHLTSGVGTPPRMFNYKLPPSLYTQMSPEMVAVLDSACVSEMFDYSALRLMKNLTFMRFSADILQNNVLPCLGLQTLDIQYFFTYWKKLEVFKISLFDGVKESFITIRRDNIEQAMANPELRKAFFQNDLEHRIGYAAYQNARNKKVLSLEKWKKYKERREQGGFFNTIEGIAGQAIHGTGAAIHEASSITTGAVSGFSLLGKKVGNLGQKVTQGLRNAQGTYRATEAQRKKLMERLEREKNRQS